MAEGGHELVDANRVIWHIEVEVDTLNSNAARHFLPRIPGQARGLRRAVGHDHPRAVLERSARQQAMATPHTTQEVRHLPSIGSTNGRLILDISRSCYRMCTHFSCDDLTKFAVPPPPPHPSSLLAPPAIGRGARLLSLLQYPPPPPPPRPDPSRVSKDKDHLPTAIVQPQRIQPPPRESDDDDDLLLQLEQLALDDEELDLANLWWD